MLMYSGVLQEGDRFPTEESIASHFGVSRPTANKSVEALIDAGYLCRDKGLGTFVKDKPFVEFTFFSDALSFADQFAHDVSLKSKIIWAREIPADAENASALKVQQGEPLIFIRRLRYVSDRPLMVCDSILSARRFPGIDKTEFVNNSLYQTLAVKYNTPVVSSQRYVFAGEAIDPVVISLLDVLPFSSILIIRGISYTKEEEPVERLKTYLGRNVVLKARVHKKPGSSAEEK